MGIINPRSLLLASHKFIKYLQGFSTDVFRYEDMGCSICGYITVLVSWFLAFDLHLCLPLQLRSLSALGFALLMYWSPWYPLALTYANGCGWNLYYCGTWGGRNFKGERFFAV